MKQVNFPPCRKADGLVLISTLSRVQLERSGHIAMICCLGLKSEESWN